MTWLVASAAAVAALGVLLKAALALRHTWKRGERVLDDLLGLPATDTDPAVPSLRVRLEKVAGDVHQVKGALPALGVGLDELADRIAVTNQRITDHRRRNEEYAVELRRELERRAAALQDQLEHHNADVDLKLAHLSDDLLRAETMRAALLELGFPTHPRERRDS